jgi:diguanylate cyclase (GGDEF)-like protein
MTTSLAERTALDHAGALDDLSFFEFELASGARPGIGDVEALLERVRSFSDDAALARTLCVLGRVQNDEGQHDAAFDAAAEALRASGRLDAPAARAWSNLRAESLRVAGGALSALGRVAEALPYLDEAVHVAESSAAAADGPQTLVRCLGTLGSALALIGELDAAIEVYCRLVAQADAAPNGDEVFFSDVMLWRSELAEALHLRAQRHRSTGESERAEHDLATVRRLLNGAVWQIDGPAACLNACGRAAYFFALGKHLLETEKPSEALAVFHRGLAELAHGPDRRHSGFASAHESIARALFELGRPREAIAHAETALEALDRLDETRTRQSVLSVLARARHALGEDAAAYEALCEHDALRARLEAVAAHQYARHMTVKLGLERARADADSHRRIVSMLETLGRIGQEMTAKLDADAVFQIFARHVGSLLASSAFTIWMLDSTGERMSLAFGVEDGRPIAAPDVAVADERSAAACAVRERREIFGCEFTDRYSIARGTRPMQTALFVPLIVAGRVLGVVSIQSDRPAAYDENERLIFRTLSTYAAIALDNAAAYAKLEQTVIALRTAQSELARQNEEFARLSVTDALTGVSNRRHLQERALSEVDAMRAGSSPVAVAIFDIDHFKRVNDSYGHAVGDCVLQLVAEAAKSALRPSDTIARIGGEEFALLLPGTGLAEATAVAERIRANIEHTSVACDRGVRVTASFGVAAFEDAGESFEHVLSRADAMLYEAKQAGRNRVRAAIHPPANA